METENKGIKQDIYKRKVYMVTSTDGWSDDSTKGNPENREYREGNTQNKEGIIGLENIQITGGIFISTLGEILVQMSYDIRKGSNKTCVENIVCGVGI